ncbi:MAG: hydrogenase expression/formation protein [Marichromatium sp.]|uniref:hydrogenase expression/formation protein n=1 Tax=Marichromatium sp. PS1 TaxID=3138932 RepID=UPI001B09102A|nr:hydrogenase expression/formation protein [Marichromatium sp.]
MQPTIPPILLGPGSHADEADLATPIGVPMSAPMQTYVPPVSIDSPGGVAEQEALRCLDALRALLERPVPQGLVLDFSSSNARALVAQALGRGEVEVACAHRPEFSVRETRLTGVWWVVDERGERLEVAPIPACVSRIAAAVAAERLREVDDWGAALGARAVCAELSAAHDGWCPGDVPRVINLSLSPRGPADPPMLEQVLGRGPVAILSRGYGSCRIESTRLRHCWWVGHFNPEGRAVLETLELAEVPSAALATAEDIADAAPRLDEILAALR